MQKNKFLKIIQAARKFPLEMALHPFLTFFAGFVAAAAIAAVILVLMAGLIESDRLSVQNNEIQQNKFNAKNCLDTFAEWNRQDAAIQNFSKGEFGDPFVPPPIDQNVK